VNPFHSQLGFWTRWAWISFFVFWAVSSFHFARPSLVAGRLGSELAFSVLCANCVTVLVLVARSLCWFWRSSR
jgi:hypothetical protein